MVHDKETIRYGTIQVTVSENVDRPFDGTIPFVISSAILGGSRKSFVCRPAWQSLYVIVNRVFPNYYVGWRFS
jgi:hypothetical protein